MFYFIVSDIHGYLDVLIETLKMIDLKTNKDNKLIFLGDYIDYGDKSCQTLYYIKELMENNPNQVVALLGNHEEAFLQWLSNPTSEVQWLMEDKDFKTIKTFITEDEYKLIAENDDILYISKLVANMIKKNHRELLIWLKKLLYYFETDNQIFVHAGIEEEAEELWRLGTPKEYFTSKFPPSKGYFYKDIVAGHVGTSEFRKNKELHEVYWDKKSHFYIDGTTKNSKIIPILKYNVESGAYTSFRKTDENNWQEYKVK